MLKKIVSLVVGATLVLATLGVAAANVATTSVYDAVNGKIAVETTVTDANAGEVYTYLAYKLGNGGSLENLQNSEVVYVDEKVIATGETSTTFAYTTDIANDAAVVVLGNPTTDATIPGGVIEEGRTIWNYTIAVGEGVAAPAELDVTDLEETAIVDIPAAVGSSIVTGVKVDGEAVDFIATNAGVKVSLEDLSDGAAIVVEISTGVQQTVVSILDGSYIPAGNAATEDTEVGVGQYSSVLALAQIEGAADVYGIEFGPNKDNYVFAAKALGQGSDGLYAIRIYGFEDENNEIQIATPGVAVFARAYAEVDGQTIYSDEICRIGLDEAAAE